MTGQELADKILERAGDDPALLPSQQYYKPQEALAAVNFTQRLFVLLTLCLETTANMQLTGDPFYRALTFFPDWIAPLRFRLPGGVKLHPSRLNDLAALDTRWTNRAGVPSRYTHVGFDLLGFYKQDESIVRVTYARSPADVTFATEPDIPSEYHPCLIDASIPYMRAKEGMQEWQKTVPLWGTFIAEARRCAAAVRARNIEQGLDRLPTEVKLFDQSLFIKKKAS
jgi:hypothetical protein